jgi:hypothetical protein
LLRTKVYVTYQAGLACLLEARQVEALMRTITELRNVAEYGTKPLSLAESAVAVAAWTAIEEWAKHRAK